MNKINPSFGYWAHTHCGDRSGDDYVPAADGTYPARTELVKWL